LVQSIIPLEYGAGLTLTSAKYYTPSGRLIQRDYTHASLYDYYTRGGIARNDDTPKPPTGPESRTDLGRPVYSGSGIMPDEVVKPRMIETSQARLLNPVFAFAKELISGRIPGFDAYRISRPIDFNHKLTPDDYPVTQALYTAFRNYVTKDPSWNTTAAQVDRNRWFVELQLRYDIVTAAYGRVTADQVLILDDPQVTKAIEVMPRARQLAMSALRARK
jgi:carboxyl-terminal processing protease